MSDIGKFSFCSRSTVLSRCWEEAKLSGWRYFVKMLYEKSSTCTSDLSVSLNSRSSEEVEMWERPVKSCWGCCSVQSYHRDLLPFCTPSEAAAICKLRCWSETRAKDEVWWGFFGFFCDAVDNHPAVFRRFDERLPAVTVVEAIGVNAAHASRVLLTRNLHPNFRRFTFVCNVRTSVSSSN